MNKFFIISLVFSTILSKLTSLSKDNDGLIIIDPFESFLNTSFNKQGKPILNTMEEAKWMLDNTGLDDLVVL